MKRGTWTLLVILVLLAGATFLVLQRPGETSTSGSTGEMLVQYDSAMVDKVEITSGRGNVVVVREAGRWMLTAPLHYRADEAAVTSALRAGKAIELRSLVSANPEKQHLFQVDSTATLVRFYEAATEKAAFRVGKPGSSFTETYVRREGSNDVYLASGYLTGIFGRSVKDWRDRSIFKAEDPLISTVLFRFGDTTFTLALRDSVWRIDSDSASTSVVSGFLGSLGNLQADDFIDTALTNLKKPAVVIEVQGVQLRFYRGTDDTKYYVQTSQSPQWFEVQNWRATQILKRKKDFFPGRS